MALTGSRCTVVSNTLHASGSQLFFRLPLSQFIRAKVYDRHGRRKDDGLTSEVWQVTFGLQKTFRSAQRRRKLRNTEDSRLMDVLLQTSLVTTSDFQAEARKQLEAIPYEPEDDADDQ